MPTICIGPDCDRPARNKEHCGAHHNQFSKYGYTWKFGENPHRKGRSTCIFEGCDNPNSSHGLCRSHKRQEGFGIELRPIRPAKPIAEPGYSWCGACKRFHPIEDFYWDVVRNQLGRTCRDCKARKQREWNAANPLKGREYRMKKKYGITPDDFTLRYREQEGRCAICREPIQDLLDDVSDARYKSAVDHDHATGRVRGLLCGPCNCAIGYMKDEPERLLAAAAYLRQHSLLGS